MSHALLRIWLRWVPHCSVQDRSKRLKLLNFIADKAELLYRPLSQDEVPQAPDFVNEDEGEPGLAGAAPNVVCGGQLVVGPRGYSIGPSQLCYVRDARRFCFS